MTNDDLHLDAPKLSLEAIIDQYKSGKLSRLYVVAQDSDGLVSDFVFDQSPRTADL